MIDPQSVHDDEIWEREHRFSKYVLAAVEKLAEEGNYSVRYMEGRPGNEIKSLQEVDEVIHRLTGT